MKKQKVVVIAGLIITIAVTGCGNSNTPVEPTESVIDTEIEEAQATEEIAETETEEEHQLFDPDEIGTRGDKFWFEDEATIAYIMNIPGVSDLSDEELDAFMNELAEFVSLDEFNGDVEQTESYIVSDLLPKYLEKQTATKETESKQPSSNTSTTQQQQSNSTSSSEGQPITDLDREMLEHQDDPADWGEYDSNAPSANWQSDNSSTPSNNTDSSANYIDESQVNNNQVGTGDQYFGSDEGADWGEDTGGSANWQY